MTITTADGERLEAEWFVPEGAPPRAVVMLCHAHPLFGGSPRDAVTSPLFRAFSSAGAACLRYAYRGVGTSTGSWGDVAGERLDALAALDEAKRHRRGNVPLVVAGFSFGADIALGLDDPDVSGWIAVAPPFAYLADPTVVGADPRPKLVVIAGRDRVLDTDAAAVVSSWTATDVVTVPGADHYFFGRTAAVEAAAVAFLDRWTTPAA